MARVSSSHPPSTLFITTGRGFVTLLSFRSFQCLVSFIYFLKLKSCILPSLLGLLSIVNMAGSRVINKPLGPFLRVFLHWFYWSGKSYPKYGQHCLFHGLSLWFLFFFLTVDSVYQAASRSSYHGIPVMMDCSLELRTKINPFFFNCCY